MLLPYGNAYLRKLSVDSVISVFVLPTVFFSNTDYKDFHGYYCLAVMLALRRVIRSIRSIRVRFKSVRLTSRVFRTRIIRIFTDVIALRQCLLEKNIRWILISVFALKVFALPTECFSNTDYKDFHGCYCFEKNIRSIRSIRVRFKSVLFEHGL